MEKKYRPKGKDYIHVNDSRILKIDKEYIKYLKSLAKENCSQKCTMCLHNDVRDNVHEMMNVYPEGTYVRPHSHPIKIESKTIIEGKLLTVIFDSAGKIIDEIVMEESGIFTTRLDKEIIHMDIPLTDVVFHEIKTGPFTGKDDSIFPEWAPNPIDTDKVTIFMKELEEKIREFQLEKKV